MSAPPGIDRRLMRATIALLLLGGAIMIAAWLLPTGASLFVGSIGFFVIACGVGLRVTVLLRRLWARAAGVDLEEIEDGDATQPVCHVCGYDLRGIDGPFCPECETVRPRRVDT